MGEMPERSPWGPWTEFGRSICGAEEAVAATIDQILTDGGTLLWQKYLERKAFSFASNAISDALVSRLRMCYVSHDSGETAVDGALRGPEWNIEDEPQPCEIDSWARMHLPVRRSGKADEASTSGGKLPGKPRRGQLASSSRPKAASGLSSVKEKATDQPPRMFMLEGENAVDPEEERMREAKAQEEARKRDKERLAKESEKTQEEERRKVQQLHEEMSKRPHTFDTEGNLIWVDELKPERLPKLVEAFGYSVKREPKMRDDKAALGTTMAAPKAKQRPRRHRGGRGAKKTDASPEFTDGFSKLQHGQPPILETMVVVPGVTLEQLGKVKSGPDDEKRFLSRREYVQLAEQEVALDSSFHGRGGSMSQDGSASPPMPSSTAPPGASPPGGEAPPGGGGAALPQIPQGRGPAAVAYPAPGADGERTLANPSQKAPPAPPAQLRMRKYEALGFGRDPRYHPPSLGGGQGLGSPQPVLGATMGHGFMKVNKEAFFFPPAAPELPLGLLRSQSDAALGSARRGNTPGREPSTGDPASEGEDGGRLRPEMSAAYRSFRHALVPGESANSTALIR